MKREVRRQLKVRKRAVRKRKGGPKRKSGEKLGRRRAELEEWEDI